MYLVNLYLHAWFFQTRAWGTLSLFLFPRAGFSLPLSWILKPKYDWERKRSVRNQRGGLSAKTRRGDMGVMGGEENFLAFLSRFLECPELFAICNIHHSYVKCAKSKRISALSNWGKNLQNNRLNARCASEAFVIRDNRDHPSSKSHRRPFLSTALRSFLTGLEDSFKFG